MSYDLIIRGGTVVDGTGAPARTASETPSGLVGVEKKITPRDSQWRVFGRFASC